MSEQLLVNVVPITPPPSEQQVKRNAVFATDEKKTRYHLPEALDSHSPVGYRTRLSFTEKEAAALMPLLSLEPPTAFIESDEPTESELFEESSLGILSARQSTNYVGHKNITLGKSDSQKLNKILRRLNTNTAPLEGASHTHIVLTRPYRTPFTLSLIHI